MTIQGNKASTQLKQTSRLNDDRMNSDLTLWAMSQLVDYGICLCLCFSQMLWGIPWVARKVFSRGVPRWVNILRLLVVSGFLSISLLYLREKLHFRLLGARVARAKTKPLAWKSWLLVLKTSAIVQVWILVCETQKWIDHPRDFHTLQFWVTAYIHLYAMILLRDIFLMWPFHSLFHHNPRLFKYHKTHHQVLKDATGMHAFYLDFFDLLVENVGANMLLLGAQYLTGNQVAIHWFAIPALVLHDAALHSVNPHSSLYFNPVLDYLLKTNVHHQLHHAVPGGDERILVLPWHHLSPSRRKADMDQYNSVFETDFALC